ncbi:hypothetical protein D1224_12205 [Henriciella barbarensis]|uniref:Lipoprotein n=1 Tax=Henriciella barbarensis TaxID=86342 RepID=A0A399QU63_9PROT|nr:hypothetical protein [Henriciella barbarensis]RIJ22310.1 hypothetical protein D1224_12205 [Henriciella barbarensis]
MRSYLLSASFILLAACAVPGETAPGDGNPAAPYERITFKGEIATPAERARCEAAGGTVQRAGMLGWENCIQTFADGGKTCSDSSDCTGECRSAGEFVDAGAAATGQCTANDNIFGCYQTIENGRAGGALCVD